ncbi:alanine--glyoxylate aminotransferase 2, mitochondrial [Agrilus planipennis]|uniref:Alanine--glyoxylate aminotransferase 2, mitochondrial n=1 Tax=Agrilus planipennis TaxID=224129 RepID=A0A1W4XUF5_AGRPL|nr:alanine--glyoxylate aminotransferase 2, mitochondrial [Agrilus planipennis]
MKSSKMYRSPITVQQVKETFRNGRVADIRLPECNFTPQPYSGLPLEKLKKIRKTRLNPALTTHYSTPLALSQGYKQWLFDIDGRRYLDMFAGVCTVSVGHAHPKITEAVSKQISTLGHVSNIYLHTKLHEYAERLTDKFPGDLKVVYFVNSGSEANELAVLLARIFTNNYEVISLRNGYHGTGNLTMNVSAQSDSKYRILQAIRTHHVINPDVYKGLWGGSKCRDSPVQANRMCSCRGSECEAKDNYVKQFEELFDYSLPKKGAAAFIAEPIQGVGGIVQYPKGYLKEVVDVVRKHGGLFISDEVREFFFHVYSNN